MSSDTNVWMVNVKDTESMVKTPDLPDGQGVTSVSCGNDCINVVARDGQLFTSKISDNTVEDWKQLPELSQSRFINVESGLSHHVAITTDNKLVSWGKNDQGQLGRGNISAGTKKRNTKGGKRKNVIHNPSMISFSQKIRISAVSCGNEHTLCLTDEGRVYSWGANDCNQLGLGNSSTSHCSKPRLVEDLACISIAQVSAGGYHSFVLSTTGLVFCWGSNEFGQLGIEDNSLERVNNIDHIKYPAVCAEKATSVCCGEHHTAFLTMDGRVYTCGLGSSGQLGHHPDTDNQFVPRRVEELSNHRVSGIACGRNYTLACNQTTNTLHCFGSQKTKMAKLPHRIDDLSLRCGKDHFFIYQRLFVDGESSGCGNPSNTLDDLMELVRRPGSHSQQEIQSKLSEALCQAHVVNGSFQLQKQGPSFSQCSHGFDLKRATEFFDALRLSPYSKVAEKALHTLIDSLTWETSKLTILRLFLLLPCCLYDKNRRVFVDDSVEISLSESINGLQHEQKLILGKWLKSLPTHHFKRYVLFFRRCVTTNSSKLSQIFDDVTLGLIITVIEPSVKVMDLLYEINTCRKNPISYQKFHIKDLDKLNIPGDFEGSLRDIREHKHSTFRFCKYPFLYNSASKYLLLKSQCQEKMKHGQPFPKRTTIQVRRQDIVKDTRERLSLKSKDLLKQLDVIFYEEIDYCGDGIRQEFFQELVKELLHEDFGACYYEDSYSQWFRVKGGHESSNLADIRFLGLICGLALFNSVTLHLQFPSVLYKKLLNEPVTLDDLSELYPVQCKSCQYILDSSSDMVEEMEMDFATPVELCPNGANILVNQSNKKEYVEKIADHYLNLSVKKEFESFRDGFYTAMPKVMLKSFHSKELEEVLVGNERYDFDAMKMAAEYSTGFHQRHPTIEMFWEFFIYEMKLEEQKKFLTFLTGTYRIPANGIDKLKITISPRLCDYPDSMLPLAATCTYTLLLPVYTRRDRLKEMILMAIQDSAGFGRIPLGADYHN